MCESVSYYFSFGFYQCFNAKDVEDAFGSKTREQVDEANKELDEGPLNACFCTSEAALDTSLNSVGIKVMKH